jgi:hypothetical protein
VHPDVDPLDQQLHDPRLLRREQFVPQRVDVQPPSRASSTETATCSARGAQYLSASAMPFGKSRPRSACSADDTSF